MQSREVVAVLLLSAATWFAFSALAVIFGMIQSLYGLSPSEITILRSAFLLVRDNAIVYLWIGAVLGFCGAYFSARENEEIRDALYLVFPVIGLVGTVLALFFT